MSIRAKEKENHRHVSCLRPLGVYFDEKYVYWALRDPHRDDNCFQINRSKNGIDFEVFEMNAQILSPSSKLPTDDIDDSDHFRFSRQGNEYLLTSVVRKKKGISLSVARSQDMKNWEKIQQISDMEKPGVIVPNLLVKEQNVFYFGDESLNMALVSPDWKQWKMRKTPVSKLSKKKYHIQETMVLHATEISEGILVLRMSHDSSGSFLLFATLLDRENPAKVLWESQTPLRTIENARGNLQSPTGIVVREDRLITYWSGSEGKLFQLNHPFNTHKPKQSEQKPEDATTHPVLDRPKKNPIIRPDPEHSWESKAAFNPAALHEGGEIHLVYRALGDDDVSVLGYATTADDGMTIKKRLTFPIYVPREPFEGAPNGTARFGQKTVSPYASGGGWNGGCEDPKLTCVDGRVYLTYVAYNGWSAPQLALSSISVADFLKGRWGKWRRPVIISRPGCVTKSGAILPEKIDGKFVVFHRVFPNILVDFVDDLDALDGKSVFLKGEYAIPPREDEWDSGKLSVGAPPIRTKDGWLVIYHSTTGRVEWSGTDCRYKMGAMLLDLENPTKVLYRSKKPILEPEMPYENDGLKYGIVYPCGAVVKDGQLLVYYGGSDEFVCVATAELDRFLEQLKDTGTARMELAAPKASKH